MAYLNIVKNKKDYIWEQYGNIIKNIKEKSESYYDNHINKDNPIIYETNNIEQLSENENLKSENENLKSENENLKSENENLKSENENLKSENENLKSENENLKSEDQRNILINALNDSHENAVEARNKNADLSKEIENLKKEIKNLKNYKEKYDILNNYIKDICKSKKNLNWTDTENDFLNELNKKYSKTYCILDEFCEMFSFRTRSAVEVQLNRQRRVN